LPWASSASRLLVVGIAAAVAIVGAGPASARTERQQDRAITALTTKLNCLARYPVTEFFDFAEFGLPGAPGPFPPPANPLPDFTNFDPNNSATYPFAPSGMALNNWGPASGLDFVFGSSPDAWLLGLKPTASCRRKFVRAANPNPRAVRLDVGLRTLIH
jgi:hypothetical protein